MRSVVVGLLACALACARVPEPRTATSVLQRLDATLAELGAFSLEGRSEVEGATKLVGGWTVHVYASRPNLLRCEATRGDESVLHVADGRRCWTYRSSDNSYVDEALLALPPQIEEAGNVWLLLVGFFEGPRIQAGVSQSPWMQHASTATAEPVTIGGERCTDISVRTRDSIVSVAVNDRTGFPRRIVHEFKPAGREPTRLEFEIAHFYPATHLDPKLFRFEPPAGATARQMR